MKPRTWEPDDRGHARWVRDVASILDRGVRWSDQVGELVTLRWKNATLDVRTPVDVRPLAVLCFAATKRDDPSSTESLCRVRWSWRDGSIRIHAIDTTSTSDEYDVTLGLLMG